MITPAMIYWVGILDSISCALTFIALLFGAIVVVCGIVWMVESDFNKEKARLAKKATVCMFFCCLILCLTNAFIPSTRLAAAMYVVPAIANNENIQAIGSNSLEALRLLTEDWLRDLADVKKNAQGSQGSAL